MLITSRYVLKSARSKRLISEAQGRSWDLQGSQGARAPRAPGAIAVAVGDVAATHCSIPQHLCPLPYLFGTHLGPDIAAKTAAMRKQEAKEATAQEGRVCVRVCVRTRWDQLQRGASRPTR
ncbi:hypothetical protein NDU88_011207 [Pleurodeles waltl]|uniref:Uncharacterized protein n=1 Tax=Pleurodeles waltl TaxID=8319 RepID=A0AAV7R2F2_PLEWA|nr:hypothetical protein NDU88_011207 [Pleurodeles waltl]